MNDPQIPNYEPPPPGTNWRAGFLVAILFLGVCAALLWLGHNSSRQRSKIPAEKQTVIVPTDAKARTPDGMSRIDDPEKQFRLAVVLLTETPPQTSNAISVFRVAAQNVHPEAMATVAIFDQLGLAAAQRWVTNVLLARAVFQHINLTNHLDSGPFVICLLSKYGTKADVEWFLKVHDVSYHAEVTLPLAGSKGTWLVSVVAGKITPGKSEVEELKREFAALCIQMARWDTLAERSVKHGRDFSAEFLKCAAEQGQK